MKQEQMFAKFTAIKDTRIVADNGTKCMNFEAGETLPVHRDMHAAAMRAGLVPEVEIPEPAPPPPKKTQEEMIHEGLLEACRVLIVKGDPKDYTLVGEPRAASAKKLVDFDFTKAQLLRAWEEAVHEGKVNGDDSQKHSEPDLSTAE